MTPLPRRFLHWNWETYPMRHVAEAEMKMGLTPEHGLPSENMTNIRVFNRQITI